MRPIRKISFNLLFVIAIFIHIDVVSATIKVPQDYKTIQMALDSSGIGDTVLVAPGIYFENIYWPETNGIKLIGSLGSDSTIITSDTNGRVITIPHRIIDTSTVIQGFTISNRYKNKGKNVGGGIGIYRCDVVLIDLKIMHNYIDKSFTWGDGCGIYFYNSNSIISNCTISNNIIDSTIWAYGGGIYFSDGNLLIENSTISYNTTTNSTWSYGSGIYIGSGIVEIIDSEVKGNYGNSSSWCYGVGIYASDSWSSNTNKLILNRVRIDSNYSGNQTTRNKGIGAYLIDFNCQFTNVLISRNIMGYGSTWRDGCALYYSYDKDTLSSTFNHITVVQNTKLDSIGPKDSAIHINEGKVMITNSIIYNNDLDGEITLNRTKTKGAYVSYSNVRGGISGKANINVDPDFISSSEFIPTNYSACVNAGKLLSSVKKDIDNNTRPLPLNSKPDLGCFEIDQSLTNLDEINLIDKELLIIFPNPVFIGEDVNIVGVEDSWFYITDATGKVVYHQYNPNPTNTIKLETSSLKAGIYFIISQTSRSSKFIVYD